MVAARIYDADALAKALSRYKCTIHADLGDGAFLWVTGWGTPFTLYADRGYFDERQYAKALAFITNDMPSDWNGNGD